MRPASDSFREEIKCTEIYIIPIKCAKTFKLLFMALVLNGHYAAAATAPRGEKKGGGVKQNTLEEKRRLSMSLSCRMTAFMDCFVSTCKSFTDGCSPQLEGGAAFQVDG